MAKTDGRVVGTASLCDFIIIYEMLPSSLLN